MGLMTELSDHFLNLRLAARFKTTLSGYVEYNLQIPGISSYDSDRAALAAEEEDAIKTEIILPQSNKTIH